MTIQPVIERNTLFEYLREDPGLHLYHLGDLDERFFDKTQWFGNFEGRDLKALALLYTGFSPPILLILCPRQSLEASQALLGRLSSVIPNLIYAHLSPELAQFLPVDWSIIHHGQHIRMIQTDFTSIPPNCDPEVLPIEEKDLPEIIGLFDDYYDGHAFSPDLIRWAPFFGVKRDNQWVSVAGVHTFSRRYRVAAIGNVITHPRWRNQGLAKKVVTRLLQELHLHADTIGLNVHEENKAAIRLYQHLGFRQYAKYLELSMSRK